MPPLSGKDAILAAARRLAELGDDALDEDLLDAELALAGSFRDEDEDFAEAPGEGEPPLRPEDLGLPPRLSAWLARHAGQCHSSSSVAAAAATTAAAAGAWSPALGRPGPFFLPPRSWPRFAAPGANSAPTCFSRHLTWKTRGQLTQHARSPPS